jgi:ribosomal protein S27AE
MVSVCPECGAKMNEHEKYLECPVCGYYHEFLL